MACTVAASALPLGNAAAATSSCSKVRAPSRAVAWRAGIEARTAVFYRLPGKSLRPARWLAPADAAWVLVVARARAADGRCWLRVRLPWRPNSAAGWVNAGHVVLEKTTWRIVVSRARRTLTVFRA